jgi:hypothetical protein
MTMTMTMTSSSTDRFLCEDKEASDGVNIPEADGELDNGWFATGIDWRGDAFKEVICEDGIEAMVADEEFDVVDVDNLNNYMRSTGDTRTYWHRFSRSRMGRTRK